MRLPLRSLSASAVAIAALSAIASPANAAVATAWDAKGDVGASTGYKSSIDMSGVRLEHNSSYITATATIRYAYSPTSNTQQRVIFKIVRGDGTTVGQLMTTKDGKSAEVRTADLSSRKCSATLYRYTGGTMDHDTYTLRAARSCFGNPVKVKARAYTAVTEAGGSTQEYSYDYASYTPYVGL
jgi:hypothetical protein